VLLSCALVLAIVPHPGHMHAAMACPLLLVVFLFGSLDACSFLWRRLPSRERCFAQAPDLPSRFQRPPPLLFV
jgi:hypothetical protein